MVKRGGPPSQGWLTLLRNHAPNIAAMDLFVVPTVGFDLLYVLVIIGLERRSFRYTQRLGNATNVLPAPQLGAVIVAVG
jgi:hypothetical protein